MQANEGEFYSFNSDLCTSLKKISFDSILPLLRNDYTSLNTDPIITGLQKVFQNNASLIYKSDTKSSNLIGFEYHPTYYTSTPPPNHPNDYPPQATKHDVLNIDAIDIIITPGFRVIFNIKNTVDPSVPLFCDMFTFSTYYITDLVASESISSQLDFNQWTRFAPSMMLSVCNKVTKSQFYYSLLGYKTINDSTDGSFEAPMTNFDAAGNLNAQIVCSLRLINSYYTGPCLSVYASDPDYNKGQPVDIPFDKNTGFISYKSIASLFSDKYPPGPLLIRAFYNQMEQGKKPTMYFLENNKGGGPRLNSYCTAQNIKVFFVEWTAGSYLTLQSNINDSASNINSPAFTVLTSAGLKPSTYACTNTKSSKERFSNLYEGSYNNSVGSSNDVSIISSPMFNITVRDTNTLVLVDSSGILDGSGNVEQTVRLPKAFPTKQTTTADNYFKTLSVVIPYRSNLPISARYSTDTAIQNALTPIKPSTTTTLPTGGTTWFSAKNTNFGTIVMSELIIFMTDGVNVDQKILNNVSTDNFSIWNNDLQLLNPDLRCNSTVPKACELDRTNPICACYPSYINNDSRFVNNLTTNMNKAGLVNTDPWCINPACASSIAYKNPSTKASSTCSSVCSAALFANPAKYGDLSIKDTQLLTTCSNQSALGGNTSPCNNGDPCPSGTTCSIDKNGSPACIPLTACSTPCNDGFQCVINNNGVDQCIPTANSTQKCTSDGDCNSGQYCDSSLKLCLQTVKQPNFLIAFGVFLGVIVLGLGVYVAYKKVKKQPFTIKPNENSHLYIILLIAGGIIALIYYFSSKNSEPFQSNQDQCSNDSDCAVNSQCVLNSCVCKIGLDINCKVNTNVITETLPYLPPCTATGNYYYSTVLNGDIYVFAQLCNFKFDGNKWQEIERLNFPVGNNQPGFAPYKSALSIYDKDNLSGFNTNMCVTYKNLVYIFVPDYTFLNSNTHKDQSGKVIQNNSFLLEYNPTKDGTISNNLTSPSGWTIIEAVSKDPVFSNITINCPVPACSVAAVNNVITVLVKNKLYIFGGVMSTGNGSVNNNVGVFDLDAKTIKVIPLSTDSIRYTYANFAQGFSSTDENIIYIVGIIEENIASIYTYDITQNAFTKVIGCPEGLYRDKWEPYTGGVTCNYYIKADTTNTLREHLSFLTWNSNYTTNANPQIGWDVVLPIQSTKLPSTLNPVTLYTSSTASTNVKVMNDMIAPLIPQDPITPLINPPNFLYISAMMTTFDLNGFKFIITGVGDIYRWSDYTETNKITNIVPCYGVALYQAPIYNVSQNPPNPGFLWSNNLGGYYKVAPSSVNVGCIYTGGWTCSGDCLIPGSKQCGDGWKDTQVEGTSCSYSHANNLKCTVSCVNANKNINYGDFWCNGPNEVFTRCDDPNGCQDTAPDWLATGNGSTYKCQNNPVSGSTSGNNLYTYCNPDA